MTIHLALVDGRMREEISTGHLSNEHLAAFLDGRLTGAERERAVRHFASCVECREELTELRDMLSGSRPGSRGWIASAIAAAAIIAFVMIPRMRDVAGPGTERVRGEQGLRLSSGTSTITVVGPADQAILPQSGLQLTWRSAGAGATYSITVQDSSGTEVWRRTSLADTSVTLPDNTRLNPGSPYFWSVGARRADGTSAETGVRSFIVR